MVRTCFNAFYLMFFCEWLLTSSMMYLSWKTYLAFSTRAYWFDKLVRLWNVRQEFMCVTISCYDHVMITTPYHISYPVQFMMNLWYIASKHLFVRTGKGLSANGCYGTRVWSSTGLFENEDMQLYMRFFILQHDNAQSMKRESIPGKITKPRQCLVG